MYLGKLDYRDPLFEILVSQVFPEVRDPLLHVDKVSSHRVYKYTEEKSRVAIIGKFFNLNDTKHGRMLRIKSEFDNLQKIRGYGFDVFPNYIVRPISKDEKIGLAVIEEFINGCDLDYYIKKAIYEGAGDILKSKLAKLASFLCALHTRTHNGSNVDLDFVTAYFQKVVNKLYNQSLISGHDTREYFKLMDEWLNASLMKKAKNAIVHGDATPTNFIFSKDEGVVAIDLERMKTCDTAFDVGMVCGELKHAFFWRTGNPFASEPFITHFLRKYSGCFSDCKKVFRKITRRIPFYMALTELRIARNSYLGWNYRKRLAFEAMECLRYGLKL
ncbi:MAG: phosphotransferase [Nitrospirota bacterium]